MNYAHILSISMTRTRCGLGEGFYGIVIGSYDTLDGAKKGADAYREKIPEYMGAKISPLFVIQRFWGEGETHRWYYEFEVTPERVI